MESLEATLIISPWIALLVVVGGCDHGTVTSPAHDQLQFSVAYRDSVGDAKFDCVDLEWLYVDMYESELLVRMTVVSLPPAFIYNHEALPENELEYLWQVHFDVNRDLNIGGDIVLCIARVKPPESFENEGPLLAFAYPEIWQWDKTGTGYSNYRIPDVVINGNTFIFIVRLAHFRALETIEETTPIQAVAYHNDGWEFSGDWVPSDGLPPSSNQTSVRLPDAGIR
jgi:hypothetical protein